MSILSDQKTGFGYQAFHFVFKLSGTFRPIREYFVQIIIKVYNNCRLRFAKFGPMPVTKGALNACYKTSL